MSSLKKTVIAGLTVLFVGLTLNTTQVAFAKEPENTQVIYLPHKADDETFKDFLHNMQPLSDDALQKAKNISPVVVVISADATEAKMETQTPALPPQPSQGELLTQQALNQVGTPQDCTAMVENALRALGYNVGDLAPMSFAQYGYKVDPSEAQAGDIMMREGHVAIYLGNGKAVHGGFNGMTVESEYDADPYGYTVIVRL